MAENPAILPDTPENRELAANCHPTDWINPEPCARYNLVVVGAGTAGLVAAAGAAGLGARVALVERHLMGGDCLNYGCVPSKGVIRASRAVHDVHTSAAFGLHGLDGVTCDFGAAMERMRRLRAAISEHDSARRFRDELGVDVFIGSGRFIGPDCMEVEGKRLYFGKAAICTGARAAAPAIPGLAEAGYLTNETVFSLTELPSRLAVIGGGPIGCELAQAFARFGSRVTLIQRAPQILGREDRDAAQILAAALGRDGIDLQTGVKILGVARRGDECLVRLERAGQTDEVATDAILVGVGRTPNLEGLGLEAAGVAYGTAGVTVNDRLQTSNPRVFAAGDICFPWKFTHTADALARVLIANALFMGRQRTSALTIPSCTYTDPEIAHVGLYETEARRKGIGVTTLTIPLSEVDRAVLDGESGGFARVHLKQGTDRILGATIVAHNAGEMIAEFVLAMKHGIGLNKLLGTIHAYPTMAEANKYAAGEWKKAHKPERALKWLERFHAWRRG